MAKKRVVDRMPQIIQRMQSGSERDIARALILGASEAARFTPRHTSTLINSRFYLIKTEGGKVVGRMGYTANYALAVHEASGKLKGQPRPKENGRAQGFFWGPNGEPEFLKKGFEQAAPNIFTVLKGRNRT